MEPREPPGTAPTSHGVRNHPRVISPYTKRPARAFPALSPTNWVLGNRTRRAACEICARKRRAACENGVPPATRARGGLVARSRAGVRARRRAAPHGEHQALAQIHLSRSVREIV